MIIYNSYLIENKSPSNLLFYLSKTIYLQHYLMTHKKAYDYCKNNI